MLLEVLRKVTAGLSVGCIFLTSTDLASQAQAASQSPATSQEAAPSDPGWPRQIVKNGTKLMYYQPQVDSWDNYQLIKGRMAFSLTPSGGKDVLGVVSIEAGTTVDQEMRTVYLHDLKYTSIRFSGADAAQEKQLEETFRASAPTNAARSLVFSTSAIRARVPTPVRRMSRSILPTRRSSPSSWAASTSFWGFASWRAILDVFTPVCAGSWTAVP